MTNPQGPTIPANFNALAELVATLHEAITQEKSDLDNAESQLMPLLAAHGLAVSDKSVRLESDRFFATLTHGVTTSVDEAAVTDLNDALIVLGRRALAKKLFLTRTVHIVSDEAAALIEAQPANIRKLFARVLRTKPQKGRITVESKESAKKAKKAAAK